MLKMSESPYINTRIQQALKNHGITTDPQLRRVLTTDLIRANMVTRTPKYLLHLKWPNFGPKCLKAVLDYMGLEIHKTPYHVEIVSKYSRPAETDTKHDEKPMTEAH